MRPGQHHSHAGTRTFRAEPFRASVRARKHVKTSWGPPPPYGRKWPRRLLRRSGSLLAFRQAYARASPVESLKLLSSPNQGWDPLAEPRPRGEPSWRMARKRRRWCSSLCGNHARQTGYFRGTIEPDRPRHGDVPGTPFRASKALLQLT
jgi:hypothetical protein